MDNFETIRELISMLNLHVRGKKMRSLEILEDFLFSSLPSLTQKDLNLLFFGFESMKGLIQSMGGENHIRKTLKNSSHYCLQLIVKILSIPSKPYIEWKQETSQVLSALDRLIVQQMKIDKHFKYAESSKNQAIYVLCLKITRVKPSLTPDILVQRKNFRDKFLGWARTQKDEEVVQDSKEKPKNIQDILGIKPFVALTGNVSAIVIEQLNFKSPSFKANFYLQRVHGNLNPLDLPRAKENLRKIMSDKQSQMARVISENSIIFGETRGFFEDLKKNLHLQLTESHGMQAKTLLSECENQENLSLAPLLKQRAEMERMKKLIQLTNKYSYLFKIPNTLQSHLSRADIESVIEVYQKHVVIIKTYSHLPVFSKVVKNLDTILLSVKTFLLQQLRKTKKLSMDLVQKTIQNLAIIEPKGEPIVDVAQVLYEIIENYLENMWVRIDKQHELPWLIQEPSLTTDLKLKELAVEQFIIRILHQVYDYIEILVNLASLAGSKKIRRKLHKISKLLTEKLSMSLFQDDAEQPLRLVAIDEISLIIKKISKILEVGTFGNFCEEFTISFIKTKFFILQGEVSELWKEEIWSRDFENKFGTCIPRIFECMIISVINSLKENLPVLHPKILNNLEEGINNCILSLLQSMKSSLNNKQLNDFISKSQKTLLTLSNTEYLLSKIFPKLKASILSLLNSSLPDTFLTESNSQVVQFSQAAINFFIENKSAKYFKVIEEGITFSEELVGIDSNVVYKYLILGGKEFSELRAYVFILIRKLAKLVFQLNRKAPHLKEMILQSLIEEVAVDLRKIIQKHHRVFECPDVLQIWAEVEFLEQFILKDNEDIGKCFHNLKKIWSKKKGLSKLVAEQDLFSSEQKLAKQNLINAELNKVKLIQSALAES